VDYYDSLPPSPARRKKSFEVRDYINYVIVAALFLIVGILLALMLGQSNKAEIDETELRTMVEEIVAEMPVSQNQTGTESARTAEIDEEQLRTMVEEIVAEMGGVQTPEETDYLADDDPYWGSVDAPVTIVEFSDFFCGYCGRHVQQTMPLLRQNYGDYIRYVYRDFPGVGGQKAIKAAMAAQCVNDQGRFWDYHALLFNNQAALQATADDNALRDLLIGYAEDLGLDTATFTTCYDNQTYLRDVNADAQEARQNGAGGTPTFFINGMILVGAQPYENFADIIDSELNRLGIQR